MPETAFTFFLPLLTYPDPTPEAGLLRALDLAATMGGRVMAGVHIVDVPPIANPLAGLLVDYVALSAAAEAASKEQGEALTRQVEHLAARLELPIRSETFRCLPVLLGDQVAAAARTVDFSLSIVDSQCDSHLEVAEALLFGSGGPVIFFPGTEAPAHLQTVVIAWDGGRAAARAVRDALPIMRLARQVAIVTVSDDKSIEASSISALVTYLNDHGIAVAHHDVQRAGRTIGEAIQADAEDHDAGLLVMGAYGHNRMREFVLGGATRTVLTGLRLPTLMSH
jgi:nucleotide-binding universal stress UspA family protein